MKISDLEQKTERCLTNRIQKMEERTSDIENNSKTCKKSETV